MPIYPAPGKDPKVFVVNGRQPAAPVAGTADRPRAPVAEVRSRRQHQHADVDDRDAQRHRAARRRLLRERSASSTPGASCPTSCSNDKAVEPLGESRNEWWIFGSLARAVQERARAARRQAGQRRVRQRRSTSPACSTRGATTAPSTPEDPQHRRWTTSSSARRSARARPGRSPYTRGVVPIKRNGIYGSFSNISSDVEYEKPLYPESLAGRGEGVVADAHGPPAVLSRPRVVSRGRRGAAGAQGPAGRRRRLPAAHDRRAHALEHPHDLAQRADHAPAAARRAGRLHERRRRSLPAASPTTTACASSTTSAPSSAWPSRRRPVQPGQVIIYHAWESFQFKDHKGQQEPIAGAVEDAAPGRRLRSAALPRSLRRAELRPARRDGGRRESMKEHGMSDAKVISLDAAKSERADWNAVEEAILRRRSIRKYKRAQVPAHLVRRMLEAGRYAPSQGNCQPWKFVVVRDAEMIRGMEEFCVEECKKLSPRVRLLDVPGGHVQALRHARQGEAARSPAAQHAAPGAGRGDDVDRPGTLRRIPSRAHGDPAAHGQTRDRLSRDRHRHLRHQHRARRAELRSWHLLGRLLEASQQEPRVVRSARR